MQRASSCLFWLIKKAPPPKKKQQNKQNQKTMDNSIIFKKKTGNFFKEIFAKMLSYSNYNQYLVQWIKFRNLTTKSGCWHREVEKLAVHLDNKGWVFPGFLTDKLPRIWLYTTYRNDYYLYFLTLHHLLHTNVLSLNFFNIWGQWFDIRDTNTWRHLPGFFSNFF